MKTQRSRGRRIAIIGGVALVVLCLAAAGFLLVRSQTTPRLDQASIASVSAPADGGIVAVHNVHNIVAEGFAGAGVRELQLWVNNQQWGSIAPQSTRDHVTHIWDWVPSGEGQHRLVARLIAADGTVTESAPVRVYATSALDVRFPVEYETRSGDTARGIANRFGANFDDLLETNSQLAPSGSLPAGLDLTVPVPFTDTPPSQTDYGEPAAPPAGGQVLPPGSALNDIVDEVHQQVADAAVLWKSFNLVDGKIYPHEPTDLIYLYLSVDGKDWGRIPKNPASYLQPQGGAFDLTPYLKQIANQAGGGPVLIHAEVWGWRQGQLVYLGAYNGEVTTAGGGLQTTATGATQVRAIDYVYLGKENYKPYASISNDAPNLEETFRWTTTQPGVTYALWQVSTTYFPAGSTLNPPGLVHQGMTPGSGGTFDLNFSKYFMGSGGGSGALGWLGGVNIPTSLEDLIGGNKPSEQYNPWLPKSFFVRVVPMKGQYLPGAPGAVAGPASNIFLVIYNPKGGYAPQATLSGPAYEAHVVGFLPYRPADPDYAVCTVHTGVWGPKGQLSCGCPGIKCESSGSSCSAGNPLSYGSCVQEGFEAVASAASSAFSLGSKVYKGAVDFVTDALASVACGGLPPEAREECEAGVGIAVNVGLASLGLPPQIPDFEKLMNEGLDYALAYAAEELSAQLGFECDKFCQDLIKAGIEGVQNPEKFFDDGLAFAAERAQAELNEYLDDHGLSWDCDATCQKLIQDAAKGEFEPGPLLASELDKAADQAAAVLNANGYPCNSACRNEIREGMDQSRNMVIDSANAAASKPPPPPTVLHPFALEQPAILTVEIFRRYESANVPQTDLDQCGLTIFNDEATQIAASKFVFSPFLLEGLELPAMAPGETIRVPIALERKFTDMTPAMIQTALSVVQASVDGPLALDIANAEAAAASKESGIVSGKELITWRMLYTGGLLEFRLSGTPFLTAAGGGQALPCVADETWNTLISGP